TAGNARRARAEPRLRPQQRRPAAAGTDERLRRRRIPARAAAATRVAGGVARQQPRRQRQSHAAAREGWRMMHAFMRLAPATQKLVAGIGVVVIVATGIAASAAMHARAATAQRHLDASSANRAAMNELVQRFEARQTRGTASLDLSALVTRSLQGKSF